MTEGKHLQVAYSRLRRHRPLFFSVAQIHAIPGQPKTVLSLFSLVTSTVSPTVTV